jgi:hypothetical protein
MRACPACKTELAESDLRCPQCGHLFADAERWEVSFASREILRRQFDECLVHRGLIVPRPQEVAPDTGVQLRLVLPDDAAELQLTARVVGAVANPSRPEAPYDVQLELLDLDATGEEMLRRAAHAEDAPPQAAPEASQTASPTQLTPDADLDPGALDAMLNALLQPWEPPPSPEPLSTGADLPEPEPVSTREKLPEEVAQDLTDFTLHLVQAITKSSYYTSEHRESEKAKTGLYLAFTQLVAERPEITFHAHTTAEKRSMLVYGVFDEPTDLARAMLKGMAEIYIPKLSHYFENNGLVSISFKRAMDEGEFHRFVDLLASPGGTAVGAADRMLQKLAELRIHHISLVVHEDRLAGRKLSWRVEMALTRLKKDLSVIPLYEHLSEAELQRIRLQVFRDVVRPLRQVNLVRELLENCDLVVAEVDELSGENLAEMEAQILASVTEESLPALLEGLAGDIVEAKREGGERTEQLLRLTRRVAQQLNRKQVAGLQNAFRLLLENGVLAREELPAFVQQKLALEHDTEIFLKFQDELLRRFDAVRDAEQYLKYLRLFGNIFPELLAPADVSAAARVLGRVSGHRTLPGSFETRAELADSWLVHLVASSLGGELLEQLPVADKVKREALLDLAREVGEAVVPILFNVLRECENASCRQDLVRTLPELKASSLSFLSHEMTDANLPSIYLCELLEILAHVGEADSPEMASRFLRHDDAQVRIAALRAASELESSRCEGWAVEALDDRDPGVQEAALKLLFERHSTAPEFFGFCGRILSHLDEDQEGMARRICAGLVGYDRGEGRARSVALLLSALGDTGEQGGGLLSSLRRSLAGEPTCLPVKIAACQALGRMGASEAADVLTQLSKHNHPALKQAAARALEQVRKR